MAAPHPSDHVDYAKRIVPLRRHLPGRMVGEFTGLVLDARADEVLYQASRLETASCSEPVA